MAECIDKGICSVECFLLSRLDRPRGLEKWIEGQSTLAERRTEPIVWIIDRQQWPRALLRAELIERGFDALGYEEIADALTALHHPRTGRPQVIVLELREQDLNQDTLGPLVEAGVPIVVLGGIPELNEPAIEELAWAKVMRRPFTLGAVADEVEELIGR